MELTSILAGGMCNEPRKALVEALKSRKQTHPDKYFQLCICGSEDMAVVGALKGLVIDTIQISFSRDYKGG